MGAFHSCFWYLLQVVEPLGPGGEVMISDNLLNIAMFVMFMMLIGLVLTILEFRYGEPKRQQERAERNQGSADAGKNTH
jgi:hypothetical protein